MFGLRRTACWVDDTSLALVVGPDDDSADDVSVNFTFDVSADTARWNMFMTLNINRKPMNSKCWKGSRKIEMDPCSLARIQNPLVAEITSVLGRVLRYRRTWLDRVLLIEPVLEIPRVITSWVVALR